MNNTQGYSNQKNTEEKPQDTREKIIGTIESTIEEKLTLEELDKPLNDIGIDSLDICEIFMRIEDLLEDEKIQGKTKFNIDIDDTPNDIVRKITKIIQES